MRESTRNMAYVSTSHEPWSKFQLPTSHFLSALQDDFSFHWPLVGFSIHSQLYQNNDEHQRTDWIIQRWDVTSRGTVMGAVTSPPNWLQSKSIGRSSSSSYSSSYSSSRCVGLVITLVALLVGRADRRPGGWWWLADRYSREGYVVTASIRLFIRRWKWSNRLDWCGASFNVPF